ncbi:hypothetical protein R0I01_08095 [Bacillus pumilus]|nr:hypothetical protein R0I01_08095 [Bacillus pumilus]
MTTDQVRELEKAKKAIENVLQQTEQQETDQTGEEPVQKVLEQVVAPIRQQLSSLEKSASREKQRGRSALSSSFAYFRADSHAEKARHVKTNNPRYTKTTQQHHMGWLL